MKQNFYFPKLIWIIDLIIISIKNFKYLYYSLINILKISTFFRYRNII